MKNDAFLKLIMVLILLFTATADAAEMWDATGLRGAGAVVAKSDAQATDTQATDAQTADAQAADAQATDTQAADGQAADAQTADAQATDAQTADAQAADGQAADIQAADAQAKREALEGEVFIVRTRGEITSVLLDAIPYYPQTLTFDVSALVAADDEINIADTLVNAYYDAVYEEPALKYAYACVPAFDEKTGLGVSSFKYMPYMTGEMDGMQLADGTIYIDELTDLVAAANGAIDAEEIPIAIVNRALTVDDMNRALGEAGYGYIVFQLSDDGMAILAEPVFDITREEALDRIEAVKARAAQIVAEIISPEMTDAEKVAALYGYVTGNVVYDARYFEDPFSVPHESRTAYGALFEKTAICGGFAGAFDVLMEEAGIACYLVSGSTGGEGHLWNYALYEGAYFYFDPTFDEGEDTYFGSFAVTQEIMAFSHTWDAAFYERLAGAD